MLSFAKPHSFVILLAVLLAFACATSAQGYYAGSAPAVNGFALSGMLETQLPTCESIQLSIETASGGATVSGSGGAFSVSFDGVNGLGISTPASGVSVSTSSGGATYTTPVIIRATFTGCSPPGATKTITVYQDATASSQSQSAAREGSSSGSVVTVPASQASATIVTSSPASGAAITRYVGVFVGNANGGSAVTGTLAPKFIYQFTVE